MLKKILFLLFFLYQSNYCHEYPKPIGGYFSQNGQDRFLNENIFKGKKNGIFIEIGAHDGISFSNTYFFEKYLGWSGICIEPNPDVFEQLLRNRNCYCEQTCIANYIGLAPFLKCTGYMLEMYSGLLNCYDSRHLKRIDDEIARYGGSKEIIDVACIPLKNLCEKYNLFHINLLSIDVEGGEEIVIQSIDFDTTKIDVILVENNFNEEKIDNYLIAKGYHCIKHIGKDDIYKKGVSASTLYVNRQSSKFGMNYCAA